MSVRWTSQPVLKRRLVVLCQASSGAYKRRAWQRKGRQGTRAYSGRQHPADSYPKPTFHLHHLIAIFFPRFFFLRLINVKPPLLFVFGSMKSLRWRATERKCSRQKKQRQKESLLDQRSTTELRRREPVEGFQAVVMRHLRELNS